jgi:large subunit ribosomal protein L23
MTKVILLKPVITEKAVTGSAGRFYQFFVHPDANKFQIKAAVTQAFKVEVESVRIVKVKPKVRRRGRFVGSSPALKKAIVKLMKDNKIEFYEKL